MTLGATDGTISGSTSVTVVAGAATQLQFSSSSVDCAVGHGHRRQRRLVHHQGDRVRRLPQPEERHGPHREPDPEPDAGRVEPDEPRRSSPPTRRRRRSATYTRAAGNSDVTVTAAATGLTSDTCIVKK